MSRVSLVLPQERRSLRVSSLPEVCKKRQARVQALIVRARSLTHTLHALFARGEKLVGLATPVPVLIIKPCLQTGLLIVGASLTRPYLPRTFRGQKGCDLGRVSVNLVN